jgi:hypothetical protein
MYKQKNTENGSIGELTWIIGIFLIFFLIYFNITLNHSLRTNVFNEIQAKLNNSVSNCLAKNIDIEAFRDGSIDIDNESGINTGIIEKAFQEGFAAELQLLDINDSWI